MKVVFVHDRSPHAKAVLFALVAAVARAASDGMHVDVERIDTSTRPRPEVSVSVNGLEIEQLSCVGIYDAIARAFRRPTRGARSIPIAVVRR